MNIEEVKIDTVAADPANVRTHSQRNIEIIAGSLRRFGQVKPIVIDANGVVRAGNGTLAAAKSLGWTTIRIVRTSLTGSELAAYAVADNRTGETSTWDDAALGSVLTALADEDTGLLNAAGFTPQELADLLPQEPVEQTPPDQFPAFDENIEVQHQCPKCGFKWSGSSAPQGGAQ